MSSESRARMARIRRRGEAWGERVTAWVRASSAAAGWPERECTRARVDRAARWMSVDVASTAWAADRRA
jgi:hypothetical protein